MTALLDFLGTVIRGVWESFFLAAPYILLGLFVAGLIQVFLPQKRVATWLGGQGLSSAILAALVGMPLPICSCGIVPVTIALRKKGASRPACLAFLITTPETGADAIALTWGMLGPLMAVVRPLATFLTAIAAGAVEIAFPDPRQPAEPAAEAVHLHADGTTHVHGMDEDAEEETISPGDLTRRLWRRLTRINRLAPPAAEPVLPEVAAAAAAPPPQPATEASVILRAVGRRAFIEAVDDIVFWLLFGLVLAGIIAAFLPADLFAGARGSSLLTKLALLVVGVPMYMCASSSTPIAAALVAKGVSPGGALVFLLSGPSTNAATLAMLGRNFGGRFLRIYLGSIAVVTLASGIALDALLAATGWSVTAQLTSEASGVTAFFELLCAVALAALMGWRLWSGAWRMGVGEVRNNLSLAAAFLLGGVAGSGRLRRAWEKHRRPALLTGAVLLVHLWVFSGFKVVPPGSLGYRAVFGRVSRQALHPGLHWAPPRPLGSLDVWQVMYPRKSDVGFRTDLGMLAERPLLARSADPATWHSPVAGMAADDQSAAYIAGDENLLELSFSVHYTLSDPFRFFYTLDKERDVVVLYAQAAAREFVASQRLDGMLATGRQLLEQGVAASLQRKLDAVGAGVRVVSVHVVDIHPPQEAVFAFRDVSSAREDLETREHRAREALARDIPAARAKGALAVATAQATADSAVTVAAGRAEAFTARASAYARERSGLHDLLWLESAERALAGRRKYIVPKGTHGRGVILWQDKPPAEAIPESPVPDKGGSSNEPD